MSTRLCLLTVHAHPDDEASKGPATVAKYHDEGIHTVLVCCTGGEEGDILNPALDTPEVRADLAEVRRRELEASTAVIGYDEVVMLGYRDSGMPDTPANARPDSFAQAPLDEAVGRLVAIIRRARPQVVVTYGDDQQGYPHPDHLRVHEISVLAFDAAGDPAAFPEAGAPFQPLKLYYVGWSAARILAMHEKFLELGLESPFDDGWLERATKQIRPYTTAVDISAYGEVRREALLAHATQVDPTSPFWFGLPPEVARSVHPLDEYILARSRVRPTGTEPGAAIRAWEGVGAGTGTDAGTVVVEDDLFTGVRDLAAR
jgi:mycothiol S-conjugate amidase